MGPLEAWIGPWGAWIDTWEAPMGTWESQTGHGETKTGPLGGLDEAWGWVWPLRSSQAKTVSLMMNAWSNSEPLNVTHFITNLGNFCAT